MTLASYTTKFLLDKNTGQYSIYYGVHYAGFLVKTLDGYCFEPTQSTVYRLECLEAIINKIKELNVC